jgi:trimeric autotransporter adhesin
VNDIVNGTSNATTLGLVLALLSWGLASSVPARAEVVEPSVWSTDGNVLAIATVGNTVYLAGAFRSVGPSSGGGVPLSAQSGAPLPNFARIAGTVSAVVPDGVGGWFVGGAFSAVGGQPSLNLAHLSADCARLDWTTPIDGTVAALAYASGVLYVGGEFHSVGGSSRQNIAAVDATSGQTLQWAPEASDSASDYGSHVSAIVVQHDTIYVGGRFQWIGGARRRYIAALDSATGSSLGWAPDADAEVKGLALNRGNVYAAGDFFYLGGAARNLIGAVDAATGRATSWDPHATGYTSSYSHNPYVKGLLPVGDNVFVAGTFDSIGGKPRGGLAAVDATTGIATEWHPVCGPLSPPYNPAGTEVLVRSGQVLYVGGMFNNVDGQDRQGLAAFDIATGVLTEWNPHLEGVVQALDVQGGVVFAGGELLLLGEWRHRAGLAALDAQTGRVNPWNPNPDGSVVTALAVSQGAVYVSGNFTSIGGQSRSCIAALDTFNGEAMPWNPGANDIATVMIERGGVIYMGGYFTQVGGLPRRHVAAVSVSSGQATNWNPNCGGPVLGMVLGDSLAYIAGLIGSIGGLPRHQGAAVDLVTGTPAALDLDTGGGFADALLLTGNVLFVGGGFSSLNGAPRWSLGAVDAITGSPTSWDPRLSPWSVVYPQVYTLAIKGPTLWLGGDYSGVGGDSRVCLAAVDTSSGLARSWDPATNGPVWSISPSTDAIYVGGGFTRAGGWPCSGLAAIVDSLHVAPADDDVAEFSLGPITPNPVRSDAVSLIRLSSATSVSAAVYDIQGRRIANLLDRQPMAAGSHPLEIRAHNWRTGVCFLRVSSSLGTAVRKILVVK